MRTGVLVLRFRIPEARSLKEKRAALRPFLDRVRKTHNVSAAEVEDQDLWQSAVVAVAAVSATEKIAVSALEKVLQRAVECRTMDLLDDEIEVF